MLTQRQKRQRDTFADSLPEQNILWGLEQCSFGLFWLLIAASLLLSLYEASFGGSAQPTFPIGWGGVFVVYYALRSAQGRPLLHPKSSQQVCPFWSAVQGFPLACVLDVFVISLLVSLSGGWASPFSLLYFGWAITLFAEPSWVYRMLGSVMAPLFLLGEALLVAPHALSIDQTAILLERLLMVLFVSLGASALRTYLEWREHYWAAERHQWKLLRHMVFSQLSHELFTPLSAIKTSTALLTEEAEDIPLVDGRQRQLLEVIGRNCTRMSLLLHELLEMWRSGQQQLPSVATRVECETLAQEMVETFQPLFAVKKQECIVVVDPPSVAVLAHRQRLEQVVMNLLSNAQKYSPVHTRVLLQITEEHDVVRFAVRDEGPGIPYEAQHRLFDLAFQGVQPATLEGSIGLGLALAKALVFAQGGRIWVESRPGQGSTFYFTLPRAPLEEGCDAHSAG
jgi:signal transduction histidine kinase